MFGFAVPLALRKHDLDTGQPGHKVLGETYVRGIMNGEVLPRWRNGYIEAGSIVLR